MLRYSLVLCAGLLAGGPAAASWADAMFDELSKDFGSVPRGPTLSHSFRVVNNTNGPVSIARVRVSCGCVNATAVKTYLEPGEETSILTRIDTAIFSGVRSVTIYVQFDRPRFEEVRLWVQANARDDFSVAPDVLALGQVRRASTPSASVNVTFYGNTDARVLEVRSETNYIQPMVKEVRRQGSEVVYEVTARLRSDTPVGKWYTDIWLTTNNLSLPKVRVPLTVEIESALTVNPGTAELGEVKVGASGERRVIVRGVKPFKITSIKGADNELLVRDSTNEAKPVHVLTVTLKPAKPGDVSRTLHVLTDLPDDGVIEFQAHALVHE
jgi:hypothetical protein